MKENIGALCKQFKPLDQVPLAVLKRQDGTLTGDMADMDQLLRENLLPIFAKHPGDDHTEPEVEAFLLRFRHLIPRAQQQLGTLTEDDHCAIVQKFAADGAGGIDGWRLFDLKRLTKRIWGLLLHLFDAIEKERRWPDELCWACTSLIPKGEGGMPLDLRPITVTPLVYRIWAAARLNKV